MTRFKPVTLAAILLSLAAVPLAAQQSATMSFFVTSAGSGKGADLGGLAGADSICQKLAAAVGAGSKTWHAYLSTQAANGQAAVNAKDRIGKGPWSNAKGQVIATDVAELHNGAPKLTKETALTEKGEVNPGGGDPVNKHDALTGTQADGTAFPPGDDRTCGNWTLSGDTGTAMLGHIDRRGLTDDPPAKSFNASHPTRGGCSQAALKGTGGDGLFYCFAVN